MSPIFRMNRTDVAVLFIALLAGAILRFWDLQRIPPGIWEDEAELSLWGRKISDQRSISLFWYWIPLSMGLAEDHHPHNEPIFDYLAAVLSRIWPDEPPLPLRRTSAFFGTIALIPFYFAARALCGRGAAAVGTLVYACARLPVLASHVGFRANGLPFFLLAAFVLGLWAVERRGRVAPAMAGAAAGLCFYSYIPGKAVIIGIILFILFLRFTDFSIVWRRREWRSFLIAYGILLIPAISTALFAPGIQMERPRAVVLALDANGFGEMLKNLWIVPQSFFWQGDQNARHNLPGLPALQIWVMPFFALGLFQSIRRWRNSLKAGILLWWVLMLAPSIVSEGAPHFLRLSGAMPAAYLLIALGFHEASRLLASSGSDGIRRFLAAGSAALILIVLSETNRQVLQEWPRMEKTHLYFKPHVAEMASFVRENLNQYNFGIEDDLYESFVFRLLLPKEMQLPGIYKGIFPRNDWSDARPIVLIADSEEGIRSIRSRYVHSREIRRFTTPAGYLVGSAILI